MSARPGPCGGHRATGVPTAIVSYETVRVSSERLEAKQVAALLS